jgi:hypothetical protein
MDATSAAFAGSPGALSAARRAKAKAKARPSARLMSWASDSGSANVGAQQCLHMNNVSQFLGPWQSDRIHARMEAARQEYLEREDSPPSHSWLDEVD